MFDKLYKIAVTMTKRMFEVVALIVLIVIIALALALSSCNVTRTVTTTAQTIQRGDTTTVIMTKTIEQYDGSVDATKLLKAGQVAAGGL